MASLSLFLLTFTFAPATSWTLPAANMQSFLGISHLLFMLQLVPAQIAPTTEAGPRVITFLELWAKSTCQPMEQLVDVEQEFPGETEYIYHPSCVPLHRCSGCCGDESKECRPTIIHNVTIELMRISPLQITKKSKQVPLTFVEHLGCECRAIIQELPKKKRSTKSRPQKKTKTANRCGRCRFSRDKTR